VAGGLLRRRNRFDGEALVVSVGAVDSVGGGTLAGVLRSMAIGN